MSHRTSPSKTNPTNENARSKPDPSNNRRSDSSNQSRTELPTPQQEMADSSLTGIKTKALEIYTIIRVAAEKIPHSVVDDMSDKFSIVLAFVSSIVLSFLFAGSVNFVKQYQMYLSCNKIGGDGLWTYDEAADKVNYNSINIVSFTAAYFLAWITYKLLRPVNFLKICLMICLAVYGSSSLINSLFFSREIIVAMCLDNTKFPDPLTAEYVEADGNCNLSRSARRMTNLNFVAIMCLLFFTSIPAGYRLARMARAAAFNEPLDGMTDDPEAGNVDHSKAKPPKQLSVGAGPTVTRPEPAEEGPASGSHQAWSSSQ